LPSWAAGIRRAFQPKAGFGSGFGVEDAVGPGGGVIGFGVGSVVLGLGVGVGVGVVVVVVVVVVVAVAAERREPMPTA
jgi:hypothetical protein